MPKSKTKPPRGMKIRELFDKRRISVFDYITGEKIEKSKKQSEIPDKQGISEQTKQIEIKF